MNDAQLKLNATHALYGLAGHSLVRLTVDFQNDRLATQLLYRSGAVEEEIERYRVFSTELFAILATEFSQLDEELIAVRSPQDGKVIQSLPVQIYCVHGAEFLNI